jgi:hypothetical protein
MPYQIKIFIELFISILRITTPLIICAILDDAIAGTKSLERQSFMPQRFKVENEKLTDPAICRGNDRCSQSLLLCTIAP